MMAEKKDNFFVSHLFDLAERAKRCDYPTFTDFMTTKELSLFLRNLRSFEGVRAIVWGGHEDCDHKMGGFFPLHFDATADDFPIQCIRIEAIHAKYAKEIGHRDFLGAILNLGIERSMIGDIRISNQTAYVFCNQEFVPFLLSELTLVRRTAVRCQLLDNMQQIPPQEYRKIERSVASLRLDNVVAAMIGSARGKAGELITQGKVLADYEERTSNSYRCKDNTIITIRGYGKYKLSVNEDNLTRKGKQKITIYQYI